MALKIIATYSKRLGLPGYSSHQFSVTVEAEINSIDHAATESTRLYQTLQASVDREIQHAGFVPGGEYGGGAPRSPQNGSAHHASKGAWQCSSKQQELILKLIDEHSLDKAEVEALAQERFDGKGVRQLNKLQASGLIDELLERTGEKPPRRQTRPAGYGGRRAR